jgi:hypothetical protein
MKRLILSPVQKGEPMSKPETLKRQFFDVCVRDVVAQQFPLIGAMCDRFRDKELAALKELLEAFVEMQRQRDELLVALRNAQLALDVRHMDVLRASRIIDAAIASAEGK